MSNYRYTITTLAPLHIGTGEVMASLEYHIANRLIVPDLQKIFAKDPNAAAVFSQRLAAKSSFDLSRTRLSQLLDSNLLGDLSNQRYSIPALFSEDSDFHTLNKLSTELEKGNGEIRLAMKTIEHGPYIPGSSIKGAIKTAWAYNQCLSNNELARQIIGPDTSDGVLKSHIFQSPSQRTDMAYDVFRLLAVGDSQSRKAEDALLLVSERILSANMLARNGETKTAGVAVAQYKSSWTFCEAIDVEMEFSGQIRFDEHLLSNKYSQVMGWNQAQRSLSLESLRQATNRFAADLCQWEIDYFERISQDEQRCDTADVLNSYYELRDEITAAPENVLYLSLGHGSGWHKLTIGLLLEKHLPKEQFAKFRRNKNLSDRYTDFEYPKSRKLVMSGETRANSAFGWVKLSFCPK